MADVVRIPQWIPGRRDAPGLLLSLAVGFAAFGLRWVLPKTDYLSDVFLALVLGAVVVNTPLRNLIGLSLPSAEREPDRYASGLRFCSKWILRGAIILMGLEVRTQDLTTSVLAMQVLILLCAVPSAFFVAQTIGTTLGLRRPMIDVIAVGTMICGASAVNASAPVVGARRQEQGLAIAIVFLFSVVALLLFKPMAEALQLDLRTAGIWSGMAVNDLSSAVAVGAQMGPGGDVVAAAAKSLRILFLAPTLVVLSLLRGGARPNRSAGLTTHLPRFILGYVALAAVRITVDSTLTSTPVAWTHALSTSALVVDFAILAVVASVGLHIDVRSLWRGGTRGVATGAGASFWLAGLTLTLLMFTANGRGAIAAMIGAVALAGAYTTYRWVTGEARLRRARWRRFDAGESLSLEDAMNVLSDADADSNIDRPILTRIMNQLQPSIGELIPVRASPLPHGAGCRWLTYWEGQCGWALVAVCREPGAATPIHVHSHALIGKTIEGELEEARFDRAPFRLRSRAILAHNDLVNLEGGKELHAIRALGDHEAIDLQLRGPELPEPGVCVATTFDWTTAAIGATFAGEIVTDVRPGQHGDGSSAGRVPDESSG